MSRNFGLSINLTKLKHVKMTPKGKDGQPVPGIFIPIGQNFLVEGKPDDSGNTSLYINTSIHIRDDADDNGQIGFQKQKLPKKWSEQTEEDKAMDKVLPYLGNLKEFSSGGGSESSGAVSSKSFDPSDDLPF